jgi:tRNA A37 threonylcarbamoyladenosine dehydratase
MDSARDFQSSTERGLSQRITSRDIAKGWNDPLSEQVRYRLRVHYAPSLGQHASRHASRAGAQASSGHHNLRHTGIAQAVLRSDRRRSVTRDRQAKFGVSA